MASLYRSTLLYLGGLRIQYEDGNNSWAKRNDLVAHSRNAKANTSSLIVLIVQIGATQMKSGRSPFHL
jgi:hypothetical protein